MCIYIYIYIYILSFERIYSNICKLPAGPWAGANKIHNYIRRAARANIIIIIIIVIIIIIIISSSSSSIIIVITILSLLCALSFL